MGSRSEAHLVLNLLAAECLLSQVVSTSIQADHSVMKCICSLMGKCIWRFRGYWRTGHILAGLVQQDWIASNYETDWLSKAVGKTVAGGLDSEFEAEWVW